VTGRYSAVLSEAYRPQARPKIEVSGGESAKTG